ncbi:MAG: M20 family peptidase [Bacteroidota bacterium]
MKKFFRRLLLLALAIVCALAGIITYNTLRFSSRQLSVAPVEKIPIDDAYIKRLQQAIRIPNISYEDHIDSSAFRQMNQLLATQFPLVDSLLEKKTFNEFSHLYRWAGKSAELKPILLMAHLDVVPIEAATKDNWQQEPFSGTIADDQIWGRGTLDDKGSVLGILEAVELLLAEGYRPERSIYLAFGHDEEISGRGGAAVMANYLKEQKVQLEYVLDEGMVIIDGALPGLSQPVALIGISEKGYTTLDLTVQLENGGHSSMPPAETAIGILSDAILTLRQHPFPAHFEGPMLELIQHVGPEMSMPNKAIFANLWLFDGILKGQFAKSNSANAIIRTTTAPTVFTSGVKDNVLPSRAEAKINFRIRPGETTETVRAYVEQTINDERVQVAIANPAFSSNPSPISSTNSFGFNVLSKTIKEIFPTAILSPSLVIAATDSRYYTTVSDDVYRFFPVHLQNEDLSRIHGIDERIGVEAYKDAIRFYRQLILNSCK